MKIKTNMSKMAYIGQKWLQILIPFSSNYSNLFTASEISKRTKIPLRTASRVLNNLLKINLISYKREGRNKLFYMDLNNPNSKITLRILEDYRALEFQLENKKVSVIINELLDHCDGLMIFGSYASKNYSYESDLDIIIFNGNQKEIKKIKNKFVIEINDHYTNCEEFKKLLKDKNSLAIEVVKNHILFGNVSQLTGILGEFYE